MQVARRIYIYLTAFISLQVMLAGVVGLLNLLIGMALTGSRGVVGDDIYLRQRFSTSGAILLVGGLVWAIHWILAQRSVAPSNPNAWQERLSVLRKLLIYGVLFVSAWQVFFAAGRLLSQLFLSLFSTIDLDLGQTLADAIPTMFVYSILWLYYWRVAHNDNLLTPEDRRAATIRRWYFYLICYGTLSALLFAMADLLRHLWELVTKAGSTQAVVGGGATGAISNDMAWIVVGGAFWLSHWLVVQRIVRESGDEQRSVLRKVYLYLMVFQTLAVTVTSLAFFFNSLLRLVLGTSPLGSSGDSLFTQAGGPLMTALVYGLMWAYHWRVLQWDASLVAEEPPRQANIRRGYHYLVALVGLAVLGTGVATLLTLLIDLALGGSLGTDESRRAVGDQVSLAATLIAVGGPVWYINWLRMQRYAMAADGAQARHALLRRIYLYLILFFSVIALLISTGTLLYRIFLIVGGGSTESFMHNLAGVLGPAITAAIFLAYHVRVMTADQRAFAALPAEEAAQVGMAGVAVAPGSTVMLVRGIDPASITGIVEDLRRRLPADAQIETFRTSDLTPGELGSWLASREQPVSVDDATSGPDIPPTGIAGQRQIAPGDPA
jgi:hypothetical protein